MTKRKRLISIVLTLAMSLALTIPALAEEPPVPREEALGNIYFAYDIGNGSFETTNVDKSINLSIEDPMDGPQVSSLPGYIAIKKDTVFTVKHAGTVDDGSYICIYMTPYVDNGNGTYVYDDFHSFYLTKGDGFYPDYASPNEGGGLVELHAGESWQFTLPNNFAQNGEQMAYHVKVIISYPQYDYSYWKYIYCVTDDAAVNKALANTSTSETPVASKPVFTDVATTSPYADAINWAVEKGITSGTTATTFSPNATCTTAQILTFLWRAKGSPEPTITNPFTDLKDTDYYYKAAIWAYEKGLISGTTLSGGTPCSRSSTVTYLWKLAGQPEPKGANPFTDVSSNVNPVVWAMEQGITAGTSATTFSPNATCTRAQIVTFLYRDLA